MLFKWKKDVLFLQEDKHTKETYIKAQELGFNFICLTGNPEWCFKSFNCEAIKEAKKYFKGLIIAGKMHAAGIDEPIR